MVFYIRKRDTFTLFLLLSGNLEALLKFGPQGKTVIRVNGFINHIRDQGFEFLRSHIFHLFCIKSGRHEYPFFRCIISAL